MTGDDERSDTDFDGANQPTTFRQVRVILDAAATDGDPDHDGFGRFWNLPLDQVMTAAIYRNQLIAPAGPNRGRNSNLVRVLRGEKVDTGPMPRMPKDRPPLSDAAIAFIERWIDEGCNP